MKGARQGNRPPALKINRESHRIRKAAPLPLPVVQYRKPIIIHTYSPKVIHSDAEHFRQLVQRLTGRTSSSTPTPRRLSLEPAALSLGEQLQTQSTDLLPLQVRDYHPDLQPNSISTLSASDKQHMCLAKLEAESPVQRTSLGLSGPSPSSYQGLLGPSPRNAIPRHVFDYNRASGNAVVSCSGNTSLLTPKFPSPRGCSSLPPPSLLSPYVLSSPAATGKPFPLPSPLSQVNFLPSQSPFSPLFFSDWPILSPANWPSDSATPSWLQRFSEPALYPPSLFAKQNSFSLRDQNSHRTDDNLW